MAKIFGVSAGRERFPHMDVRELQMQKFVESRVNKGMITMLDPADIEPGAMQLIRNATVRFDRTARRPGSRPFTPGQPDAHPVMRLAFMKKKEGNAYTVRLTPESVHTMATVDWNVIAGILTGTVKDRFQTTVVLDEFVFANNGVDYLQVVDFVAQTFGRLGNAPRYRYVTGMFNRVVGAARRDENEIEVGWSADADVYEWNPLVNETAGSSPIIDSPADLSDWIKGIFAFTTVGILLREKSVWLITKVPIPQNPFAFHPAVPGIGCDSPFSAAIIGDGLAWLDRRTGTVYAFTPGSPLEAIGRPIEKSIVANIDDPETIFSSYDPIANEYSICIPQVPGGELVVVWTYNRRNKAWAKNEYQSITSINDAELAVAGTQIDQLGPVPINSLPGTIDGLSPTESIIVSRTFGRADGSMAIEDINEDIDAPQDGFPTGYVYPTQLVSKAFTVPEDDIYIAQINIEYQSNRGGTFTLEYSKTGGAVTDLGLPGSWKLAKTVTPTVLGQPRLLIFRRMLHCRRFAWRLTTTAGLFETLSYEVHVYPSGKSRK